MRKPLAINCSRETSVLGGGGCGGGSAECRAQSRTGMVMTLCPLRPGPPLLMEKNASSLEGSLPLSLLACLVSEVKPRCSRLF